MQKKIRKVYLILFIAILSFAVVATAVFPLSVIPKNATNNMNYITHTADLLQNESLLDNKEKIATKKFVSILVDSTTPADQDELNRKFGVGAVNMGFPVYDSVADKTWIIFGDSYGGVSDVNKASKTGTQNYDEGNYWVAKYRCQTMLGFDNDIPISETDPEICKNRFDAFYSHEGIKTVAEHTQLVDAALNEDTSPSLSDGAFVGQNSFDADAMIHGHYKNIKFVSTYGEEATESSKIPTGAIEINGVMYMFFFSKATDVGKADRMNYGGCIKSTDHGNTWVKVNELSWANHSSGNH